MYQLVAGASLLVIGIVVALIFRSGITTGEAVWRWPIEATRESNPVGFWFIQSLWAVFALVIIGSGLAVIFGFLAA